MSFLKLIANWMKIKFSFKAKKEFINSAKFYEGRVVGLGKRFKQEIRNQLDLIQNNPKSAELKYKDIRVLVIKTFPFTIHYKIEKEYIVIVAIFHSSRNPEKLR